MGLRYHTIFGFFGKGAGYRSPPNVNVGPKLRFFIPGRWYNTTLLLEPFYGSLDFVRDNPVSRYQKKHSPTHTYHDYQSSFICFLHLLQSMASSVFNLCAWQCFSTVTLQLPLVFLTQSLSSFCNTCPYHQNLFYCSTEIMSSNPSLSQPFSWKSIL